MNTTYFKDKVVVITGASGGVGRATAWEFAKHGAKIALLARSPEQLEGTKKEVEEYGGTGLPVLCDVADAQQVEQAADQVERELGPIAVWVNNVSNSVFAPFKDITPEEYKRATEVTYLGTVRDHVGPEKNAAAQQRFDRACGIGSRLPRHPSSICLLRQQAWHRRLL